MEILADQEFSGFLDAWWEYLCLRRLPDGRVEVSSRSRELLGYENQWFGDPVWPEGYDPEDDDRDVLPVTVGGKAVFGRDGCGVVGEDLLPHSDDLWRSSVPVRSPKPKSGCESTAGATPLSSKRS